MPDTVVIKYQIYAIDLHIIQFLQKCRENSGFTADEVGFLVGSRNRQVIEEIEDPSLKLKLQPGAAAGKDPFSLTYRQLSVYDPELFNLCRLIYNFSMDDCFKNSPFPEDLIDVVFEKKPVPAGWQITINREDDKESFSYMKSTSEVPGDREAEAQTLEYLEELLNSPGFTTPTTALDIFLDLREKYGRTFRPAYIERALNILTGKSSRGGKLERKRTAGIRLEFVKTGK